MGYCVILLLVGVHPTDINTKTLKVFKRRDMSNYRFAYNNKYSDDGKKILDIGVKAQNSSRSIFTGERYNSTQCGSFIILGQASFPLELHPGKLAYQFFIVEFEDGTQVICEHKQIKRGKVKNPYHPIVHGVGFHGRGRWQARVNNIKTRQYKIWVSILQRCYSKINQERHPSYVGCSVAPCWHCFQNFCDDLETMENYDAWLNDLNKRNKWDIDKDIKVEGNRVYGPDTCLIVPNTENYQKSAVTGLTYIATWLSDGHEEEFTNMTEFSRQHNLPYSSGISACISGKNKSYKGLTFRIKEENNKEK